ncbi:MAG: hypothetical protein E6J89_01980 [Deltaproteobacteria bacterium]|nr:MAG: hypothetical protein E6J89_01980 [Deltaproteobacteria bacterium]
MKANPVLHEGLQVYWIEGHAFVPYACVLALLAPIEFLTLFLPSLDPQAWMGPANLFKASSIAALILITFFVLKLTNQEFVPWKFQPLRRWLEQEGVSTSECAQAQLALLLGHALFFVSLSAPLLIWAGTVARAGAGVILTILLLLLLYSVAYGVWGLAAVSLWERKAENRQVFVRALFGVAVFLSALFYLPLNPIAYLLSYLGRKEMAVLVVGGWKGSATMVHLSFHFLLLVSGLVVYRLGLRRVGRH